jgi:hypothetical protein
MRKNPCTPSSCHLVGDPRLTAFTHIRMMQVLKVRWANLDIEERLILIGGAVATVLTTGFAIFAFFL